MKVIRSLISGAFVLALLCIMLISSVEIAAYSDFTWYEKEYEKYQVLGDLDMEMKDARYVTEEMMSYLRGDRDDLVVETIVSGEAREFFNEREKAHMVDVRGLFVGGIYLRRIAIIVLLVSLVALAFCKTKKKQLLAKAYLMGAGGFIGCVGILAILIARDFNEVFFKFHELFFTNDLWLLDWNTDLLIRMLPEGFFYDMAIRIGVIFVGMLMLLSVVSIVVLKKHKKNL